MCPAVYKSGSTKLAQNSRFLITSEAPTVSMSSGTLDNPWQVMRYLRIIIMYLRNKRYNSTRGIGKKVYVKTHM
jgi:hypothetical protein